MEQHDIQKLFTAIADAWNKGDAGLYASYFTENCDYVTFDGKYLQGREENRKFHENLFNGFLKGSTLHGKVRAIRFLTGEIAIVHQTGAVKLRFHKNVPKNRLSINTNVVVRSEGAWKVTAFHNCRISGDGILLRLIKLFSGKEGRQPKS
jgi:uncharacterized protein (TIGR02246 family)